MTRAGFYKLIGTALLISFIIQAMTVIIMLLRIKVPDMQMIFEIHEYNGLVMAGLVIAHIILNWGWIKANLFGKKSRS